MPLHEIKLLQPRNMSQQQVNSHFSADSLLTTSFWNRINIIIGLGRKCNNILYTHVFIVFYMCIHFEILPMVAWNCLADCLENTVSVANAFQTECTIQTRSVMYEQGFLMTSLKYHWKWRFE